MTTTTTTTTSTTKSTNGTTTKTQKELGLKVISVDDLESCLVSPTENKALVTEIFMHIMKGVSPRSKRLGTLTNTNWQLILKEQLDKKHINYFDVFEENPFIDDHFEHLTIQNRVLVLKALCDWSLVKSKPIIDYVNSELISDPESLRTHPIGSIGKIKYWFFGDYRLYKETLPTITGARRKSLESKQAKWECKCATKDEWDSFMEELSGPDSTNEMQELHESLTDILPSVTQKFAAKKRKQNRNTVEPPTYIYRSQRLLEMDLRKKEQEKLLETNRNQQDFDQQQNDDEDDMKAISASVYGLRPRSTRNVTLFLDAMRDDDDDDDNEDDGEAQRPKRKPKVETFAPSSNFISSSGRRVNPINHDYSYLNLRGRSEPTQEDEDEEEQEEQHENNSKNENGNSNGNEQQNVEDQEEEEEKEEYDHDLYDKEDDGSSDSSKISNQQQPKPDNMVVLVNETKLGINDSNDS
eukprot:gene2729-3387_t